MTSLDLCDISLLNDLVLSQYKETFEKTGHEEKFYLELSDKLNALHAIELEKCRAYRAAPDMETVLKELGEL